MDEDTAGVLMEKLKTVDKGRFRGLVVGYSWWRRVLKHTKFPKYKTVELEDYSAANLPPRSTKTKMTSEHVAQMLKDAARKVAGVAAEFPLGGQFLSLVSVSSKLKALTTPRPVSAGPEVLELINSLRPDLPAMLSVERLEQVELESEGEGECEGGEYMEDEMKPEPVEPKHETVEISDSDSDSVSELDKEDPGPCWRLDYQKGWTEGREGQYSRILCPVCRMPISITSSIVMERHLSFHRDNDLSVTMRWQCGVCRPTQMDIDAINIGLHMELVHNAKVLVPAINTTSLEPVQRDMGLPTQPRLLTEPTASTSGSQGRSCISQKSLAELPTPASSPAILKNPANPPPTPKPGSESPTQYWKCKASGTHFLIFCPAPRCNSWVRTKKISNHFQKVHRSLMEQLLAGRGCDHCGKIVPLASLHLHLRCMNQRPAKLPKPAQSRAKQRDTSIGFKIYNLPPTVQVEEIQMQAALLSECKASTSTGATPHQPEPSPSSARGPGSRRAGESSEESPRKRLKTGEDSVNKHNKEESTPCWRLDTQKGWREGREGQYFCRIVCPICRKRVPMTCPSDMECHMLVHSTRRRTANKSWQCGVCKRAGMETLIDASNVGLHMTAFHNAKIHVPGIDSSPLEPPWRDTGLSMDTMEANIADYLEHMNRQAGLPPPVLSLPSPATATSSTANPALR